jgi:hypothetical protein
LSPWGDAPYNPATVMRARDTAVACFLLFGALLVWPLLAIAHRPTLIAGVPALVLGGVRPPCGTIPYIALQLKAVSASFKMILREESVLEVFDPALLVAATRALFGILFGARQGSGPLEVPGQMV